MREKHNDIKTEKLVKSKRVKGKASKIFRTWDKNHLKDKDRTEFDKNQYLIQIEVLNSAKKGK